MQAVRTIAPVVRDLGGGFTVRRLLPAAGCPAVGPFVFMDHFGPIDAGPADDHDVRPHPHIGLSTVTWLYEGALLHHDTTGARQRIEPGAINWMTAGRGVVHSERTPPDLRDRPRRSHGLQLWAALPADHEEDAPSFRHAPADTLPRREGAAGDGPGDGVVATVLVGAAFGATSPVQGPSPTLFVDLRLAPGAAVVLHPEATPAAPERAIYVPEGSVDLDGGPLAAHVLAVLPPDAAVTLRAGPAGARMAVVGGETLGHRHLFWNFVSSRREHVRQAADDWAGGRFPPLPGEPDVIALPPRRLA